MALSVLNAEEFAASASCVSITAGCHAVALLLFWNINSETVTEPIKLSIRNWRIVAELVNQDSITSVDTSK